MPDEVLDMSMQNEPGFRVTGILFGPNGEWMETNIK
jgi:hypothetical protein